jgi:type IV secretion system protein VirD4
MTVIKLIFAIMSHALIWGGKTAFWLLKWLYRSARAGFAWALQPRSVTHGSARWATAWEMWRGGAFGGHGIILGKRMGRFFRLNRSGYALLVAPTRSGKGTGVIIPSILSSRGSVIVTDIKAENYDVTQRDRRRLGPVFKLDLSDPEASDCFNPLDQIRVGDIHEADDALALANLLVDEELNGAKHWDFKARELLQGLIIYVCRRYADRPELRTLAKIKVMTALGVEGLIEVLDDASDLGSPTLRDIVASLRGHKGTDEIRSIVSNADKALLLFASDRPGGLVTRQSDFSMALFKKRTASLYLIVEEEKLAVYGTFLRVMLGSALMAQMRDKEVIPKHKTLFVIDEAAAIGRIPEIETGVGYLAAFCQLLIAFQDFPQLERTYPKAKSIIANATALVAFGVNELDTAKRLSEMIGRKTEVSHSEGVSQASTALLKHQASTGRSETGRALLDPSEILRMPGDEALVFLTGVRHPIKGRKIVYFRERRYRGRWDYWRGFKKPRSRLDWLRLRPQG